MPKSKKQKYVVAVTRTSYAFRNIEVEASNDKEAKRLALDTAGNYEFTEKDASYEVDAIHKQSEK